MKKVYILGGAQTDFERNWKKEGKGMVALLKEAVADGLTGAGLSFEDVRALNREDRVACFVGNFIAEKYTEQGHLGAFLTEVDPAFYGVPSARYEAACASSSAAIDAAGQDGMVCAVGSLYMVGEIRACFDLYEGEKAMRIMAAVLLSADARTMF